VLVTGVEINSTLNSSVEILSTLSSSVEIISVFGDFRADS